MLSVFLVTLSDGLELSSTFHLHWARNFEGRAREKWFMPAAYVEDLKKMSARPNIKAGHGGFCAVYLGAGRLEET